MERYVAIQGTSWSVQDTAKQILVARCVNESAARQIAYALNLETKDTQLVAVPNETCKQMGELMDYYVDHGVSSVNRTDVIKSAVNAIHKTVFNKGGK